MKDNFNHFKELAKIYNQPIPDKKEILSEIETLILLKQYFQRSSFRIMIKNGGLEERTFSQISNLKKKLDFRLDFVTEIIPEKADFYEIMNKYKELDPDSHKYYTTLYETGEPPEKLL